MTYANFFLTTDAWTCVLFSRLTHSVAEGGRTQWGNHATLFCPFISSSKTHTFCSTTKLFARQRSFVRHMLSNFLATDGCVFSRPTGGRVYRGRRMDVCFSRPTGGRVYRGRRMDVQFFSRTEMFCWNVTHASFCWKGGIQDRCMYVCWTYLSRN